METLIRLGRECNQNCIFCNIMRTFKTKNTFETKKEIIEMTKKYPNSILSFTGGEPTIRNDLLELIFFAKQAISRVELQTNAVRCSYKHYVAGLKKAGLDGAFVALHSHKERISDSLTRAPGTFKLTLDGINNLLNENIEVNINIVINSVNYKTLIEYVKFLNKNFSRVKRITFSFVQPFGSAWSNKWIVPRISVASPYIRAAMQYCVDNNVSFSNPYCGIPLCHAKGFEKYCLEYATTKKRIQKTHEGVLVVMKNKVKAPQCKDCLMNEYCLGVWDAYPKIHGLNELNPIS